MIIVLSTLATHPVIYSLHRKIFSLSRIHRLIHLMSVNILSRNEPIVIDRFKAFVTLNFITTM